MKERLRDELIAKMIPYIENEKSEEVKMIITATLQNYEIRKAETGITVYQGDINDEILKRFLMAKIARGLSNRTVQYYKTSIKFTLLKIGKRYDEVTPEDIRVYLALRVRQDGVSKTTANNERRNLSAFYGWLQTEELLLKNPMAKVEVLKETKKKKTAFTKMDVEKIRNACRNTKEEALVETLISTWARISEVVQIRIDEIKDGQIIVHGKGDKERTVYLNPKAQLAIERYLKERHDNNPYLFPRAKYAGDVKEMSKGVRRKMQGEWYKKPELVGEGHMDMSTAEGQIRRIGRTAEVENAHPHRFRRTGATMALRNGMPLTTVSRLLGHANIGTTQIYLDISDAELEAAHDRYVF